MESSSKVSVLFGSQTGNAEDLAERIGRQIIRLGCQVEVLSLNEYNVTQLILESFVIFVCSTTGNGEFPDSMKVFWRFLLRKDLPNDSLSEINFCVFGLGDSSYDKFNVVAKKLNKRLLQLGASELIPLTLADDQHELGYDAAFDSWIESLKYALISYYSLQGPFLPDNSLMPSKFSVCFLNDTPNIKSVWPKRSNSYAVLNENLRVTSMDHFQIVNLLKFNLNSDVNYYPGDVAVVWPENPEDAVEEFLTLLSVPIDLEFKLRPTNPSILLPDIFSLPCTVRQCATSYFDIMSIPKRSFFEFFHHFSKDELEKEKLEEFCTAIGQEELFSYCNRPRRTVLEVLKDFPNTTCNIPFEYMFDMIPGIRSRSFSIASALSCYPNEFHLLVAVVEYKTRLRKPRKGLCSNWLSKLRVGTTIPYLIRKGSIILPKGDMPILMVGPGTGCAPFRSFIQERVAHKFYENYLFFGCRSKAKDFFFSNEWNALAKEKYLQFFAAFSRDQDEKCYVQHKILENSRIVSSLIMEKQCYIYVAGNSKQMPQGVRDAFVDVLVKEFGMTKDESQAYLEKMIKKNMYQQETWS